MIFKSPKGTTQLLSGTVEREREREREMEQLNNNRSKAWEEDRDVKNSCYNSEGEEKRQMQLTAKPGQRNQLLCPYHTFKKESREVLFWPLWS